jgi:hypothetical protein
VAVAERGWERDKTQTRSILVQVDPDAMDARQPLGSRGGGWSLSRSVMKRHPDIGIA